MLPGAGTAAAEFPAAGSGKSFRDCATCPELVVVPGGEFIMGSRPDNEGSRSEDEGPRRQVQVALPLAVGQFAVTFEEWDTAQADGDWLRITQRPPRRPDDRGWGRGRRPVIDVSWSDAEAFANWLAARTAKPYRLLSEAEREYGTRAGSTTPYWWGRPITSQDANYDPREGAGAKASEFREQTVAVDSFKPNP